MSALILSPNYHLSIIPLHLSTNTNNRNNHNSSKSSHRKQLLKLTHFAPCQYQSMSKRRKTPHRYDRYVYISSPVQDVNPVCSHLGNQFKYTLSTLPDPGTSGDTSLGSKVDLTCCLAPMAPRDLSWQVEWGPPTREGIAAPGRVPAWFGTWRVRVFNGKCAVAGKGEVKAGMKILRSWKMHAKPTYAFFLEKNKHSPIFSLKRIKIMRKM